MYKTLGLEIIKALCPEGLERLTLEEWTGLKKQYRVNQLYLWIRAIGLSQAPQTTQYWSYSFTSEFITDFYARLFVHNLDSHSKIEFYRYETGKTSGHRNHLGGPVLLDTKRELKSCGYNGITGKHKAYNEFIMLDLLQKLVDPIDAALFEEAYPWVKSVCDYYKTITILSLGKLNPGFVRASDLPELEVYKT